MDFIYLPECRNARDINSTNLCQIQNAFIHVKKKEKERYELAEKDRVVECCNVEKRRYLRCFNTMINATLAYSSLTRKESTDQEALLRAVLSRMFNLAPIAPPKSSLSNSSKASFLSQAPALSKTAMSAQPSAFAPKNSDNHLLRHTTRVIRPRRDRVRDCKGNYTSRPNARYTTSITVGRPRFVFKASACLISNVSLIVVLICVSTMVVDVA